MHVLITGGYGLLGREVASVLLAGGHRVYLTARTAHDERRAGASVVVCDLTDPDTLGGLPSDVDAVVHAAALVSTARNAPVDVAGFWRANTLGTMHLLAWAERTGVRTCVYCSTVSVYAPGAAQPLTEDSPALPGGDDWAYALSKLAGEVVALKSALPRVMVLRFSTIYGPGMRAQRVIPTFVEQVRSGGPITLHRSRWTGDFLYVKDAAAAVSCALDAGRPSGVYNIASGTPMTLAEVADAVWKVAAPQARITITSADDTPTVGSRVDISKARAVLGYQPRYSLRAGLADWLGEPA